MVKLRDIIFEVLSNYQDKDIRNENVRLEIASSIEEKWKNIIKKVATSVAMKKSMEQLTNRLNSGIITGPSDGKLR